MNRPTPALLVVGLLLALVGVLLLLDPLGLFAPADLQRGGEGGEDMPAAAADAGRLTGRPGAPPPSDPRWIGGDPVGVLTLDLGTATLEGTVTGEGAPLPHARVRVALEPRKLRAAVRSDKDGAWRIEGLPAGSFDVHADLEGWQGRTVTTPALAEHAALTLPPVDLVRASAPSAMIRVRVLDAFDRPVPDARVLATTLPWAVELAGGGRVFGIPDAISKAGRTDERGEVDLASLPAEAYDVVVLAPGFQVASQPALQVGRGQTRLVVFRLQEGLSISGSLVDAEGKPLAQGHVAGMNLATYTMVPSAVSGPDGHFVLEGLRPGRYMLFAFHEEHGQIAAPGIQAPSAGNRLTLPGAGKIDLRVQRPDGTPVPSYRVRPYTADPYGYVYSLSLQVDDPEGHTVITHPAGNWTLSVQSPEGDLDTSTTVRVEIGSTVKAVVTLPETRSVSGVVVDDDGLHVAGAEVYVRHGGFPTGPTWEQYARTDASGTFRVSGLGAEPVKLHVTHASYADLVQEVVPSGEGEGRDVTLTLHRGATIEGVVTRDGTAVAGEEVNLLQQAAWWDARTTRTDETGRYGFAAVAPGTWTLTTGAMEFGASGATKAGVVVADSSTQRVDFEIGGGGGPGVVTGVVTRAGQPVVGATVTVVDARGADLAVTVETGASGAFRAEGLQPGVATLRVRSEDDMTTTVSTTIPDDGTPARADVVFGSGSLAGRLVDPDDAPVAGAWIQIERENAGGTAWGVRAGAISDVDGRFDAQGLEDGRYRVRVAGGAHAGLLTTPQDIRAGQPLDLGTLRLVAGATLTGRVTDDRGTPVEDATITLKDEGGRPVSLFSLVSTGSDGRYRMTGLAPGRYVVGFEARGYAPSEEPVTVPASGATADGRVARGGSIEVVVKDAAGRPLPGVRASLKDERGNAVRRTLSFVNLEDPGVGYTDGAGRALLEDLAPGTYTVEARLSGHVPERVPAPTARVQPGARANVEVTLLETGG